MEALNRDCFAGEKSAYWLDVARGMEKRDGEANGGIYNPQREHLKLGQFYYRFTSGARQYDVKVGSPWWLDFESLNNIYRRFLAPGAAVDAGRSSRPGTEAEGTFREWLALPYDWSSMEEIVIARLCARLDAWSGVAKQALGRHALDTRKRGYAPHLAVLFEIKQFCVPDVCAHRTEAFPTPLIVPFSQIQAVAAGRIL